jgi:hypothetical protein
MRYYAAKQRKTDGKWDYTMTSGDFTQPVGYCASFVDWTPQQLKALGLEGTDPILTLARSHREKHHECGHETQSEAEECYKTYTMDQRLRLMVVNEEVQRKCEVCGKWTGLSAMIDTKMWDLCEDHNNFLEVEKLYVAPAEIWKS